MKISPNGGSLLKLGRSPDARLASIKNVENPNPFLYKAVYFVQ
jgi:hypothetical protein